MPSFLTLMSRLLTAAFFITLFHGCDTRETTPSIQDGAYIFTADDGRKLRLTPYGDAIIRAQSIRADEEFFADDRYEMVETHQWPRTMVLRDDKKNWRLEHAAGNEFAVTIDKKTLALNFSQGKQTLLTETKPVTWKETKITAQFVVDEQEHFTGLGHGYYARESSIDLRGKVVERNYGRKQIEQAPLIVPFYLSSKGYGVFLNSTFTNRFSFGADGDYSIAIDDDGFGGRMDYFVIAGPNLRQVLDNYTQLTGRPRLPAMSMFGLQLTDKSHDHNSSTPSDEQWWKHKVVAHRAAGYPLDHLVNDNRWRAAGGQRCVSKLEWDKERYPDPRAYAEWQKAQGVVMTVDFNRCIGQFSDGWKPEFNIPETGEIDFAESAPDLTNTEFRRWFWQLFYDKTLNPALGYPNDALWIDEFDEMGAAPKKMILADGRSSAEMRNYWFFLIAKSLVQEGWDKSDINKRPFVWVRGMTAGAQRYATLWSGDIQPSHADMANQIRSMQLAGLSGFPFWGHDAGGFFNFQEEYGPDDKLYQQWAMAFGSFAPVWKPHGMGQSRWPLDRSIESQAIAHKYAQLRYELMPYLYTAAHQATATGTPIARPMLLDYGQDAKAWQFDLQYMWGDNLLIAPNADATDKKSVWLPAGQWYDYETKQPLSGDQVLEVAAPVGSLPIFAKAGAIIPKREFALSTAFIDAQKLQLDIYAGADGSTQLIEDDGVTEDYRRSNAFMRTDIHFQQDARKLTINAAQGSYAGAPEQRSYAIHVYGLTDVACAMIGDNRYPIISSTKGDVLVTIPATAVAQSPTIIFAKADSCAP